MSTRSHMGLWRWTESVHWTTSNRGDEGRTPKQKGTFSVKNSQTQKLQEGKDGDRSEETTNNDSVTTDTHSLIHWGGDWTQLETIRQSKGMTGQGRRRS